ncbi:hypothetical protein B0H14DRAFT_3513698 [Mycena olivaceomarginata]|nr:hypothetical protein B0H14DRAFT_3513698 [Mycena olivaceomarginata]
MSQYEILHSGQYWQDLRRRAKEAKAAHAAQEELQADTLGPNLCNGTHIYTFVPGSAVPFTSLQQRNGKLLPLSGPSSTQKHEAAKLAVLHGRCRRAKEKARAARGQEAGGGSWVLHSVRPSANQFRRKWPPQMPRS